MNVNFRAPRRVGFGKLPNARGRRLQGGSASLGRTNLPLDFGKLPNAADPLQEGLTPFFKKSPASERERAERGTSEASERELAFVPPWGRGEMKKHFCAAGPFSQDSGRGAQGKHTVGRLHKGARWESAWGPFFIPKQNFPPRPGIRD